MLHFDTLTAMPPGVLLVIWYVTLECNYVIVKSSVTRRNGVLGESGYTCCPLPDERNWHYVDDTAVCGHRSNNMKKVIR